MTRVLGQAAVFRGLTVSALLLSSCSSETALLVEVDSTLSVPGTVDQLEMRVVGSASGQMLHRLFVIGSAFPHSFAVRPGADDAEEVTITVAARKLPGASTGVGDLVTQRVVIDRFVRGSVRTVRIVLDAGCVGIMCPPGQDCVDGMCAEPMRPDAGVRDAGTRDTGAEDAGGSDGGSPDAGPVDAGAVDAGPVDSGRTDAGPGGSTCAPPCASCALSCGGAGSCSCSGGCACTASCRVGASCTVGCSGGGTTCTVDGHDTNELQVQCSSGSTCTVDATGAATVQVECTMGTVCTVDCGSANRCELACSGGMCLLRCAGATNCDMRSCRAPVTCPDSVIVCNRTCP